MDDNKVLTLVSSDRIPLTNEMVRSIIIFNNYIEYKFFIKINRD